MAIVAGHLAQQRDPGRTGPLRPRGPKVRTQIPEAGRGKQRITSSMSSGIPIRMPGKPRLPWPLKPRKKQSPARLKRMHIHPKSHPRQHLHRSTLQVKTRVPWLPPKGEWHPAPSCGARRHVP